MYKRLFIIINDVIFNVSSNTKVVNFLLNEFLSRTKIRVLRLIS